MAVLRGDAEKSVDFGMGAAVTAMPSLADKAAVGAYDNGPDHRIGGDVAGSVRGQLKRSSHPYLIYLLLCHI